MAKVGRADRLQQDRQGDVLILSFAQTGAEAGAALGDGDLAALAQALTLVARDDGVRGVILALQGGQPLNPAMAGAVTLVCAQIEALAKPVIACLESTVGGAVWALALAAHYRFAAQGVQIVLPEARFGLLAGAGISQRLPRLIGAAETIRLMLGTRPEPAAQFLAMGALDRVVDGDLLGAALGALDQGLPPRRTRDTQTGLRDAKRYLTEVRAFADRVTGDPLDVSRAVVKVVEAALLLPFAAGLAFEAATLEDLAQAPETRAVRHAFGVERAARARLRAVAGRHDGPATVDRLGIWGGGAERAEVVLAALSVGMTVVAAEPVRADLVALLNRVAALHETLVAQQAITPEARDADWARLETGETEALLAGCDLVLAAQSLSVHRGAVVWLEASAPGGIRLLPAATAGGHAELGLPIAGTGPETGPGAETGAENGSNTGANTGAAVALTMDLARRLGWRLQVVGPQGFVAPQLRQAQRMLVARLTEIGHKGPEISAGLALVGMGSASRAGSVAGPVAGSGAVSGAGSAARRGAQGAAYDIGQMALAALANEGARLLEEGIAQSPDDVDAAALACGMMPRWMGGPMYQADLRGLILIRADLARLGGQGRLATSALLDLMIAEGERFYGPA